MEFKRYRPLLLSAGLILLDQITKALVVANVPGGGAPHYTLMGDFFWLIHVRNLGGVFGLGGEFITGLRIVIFIIIPLIVLPVAVIYLVRRKELTEGQCWMLAAMIGGGVGNLIDRIFRSDGVVDFLSFKVYGLFGWERFPAFNVADSSIVVGSLMLLVSLLVQETKGKNHG